MQLPPAGHHICFYSSKKKWHARFIFCELHFRATIKSFVYRTIFLVAGSVGVIEKNSFFVLHSSIVTCRKISNNVFLFLQIDATKLFSYSQSTKLSSLWRQKNLQFNVVWHGRKAVEWNNRSNISCQKKLL